ncbi:MAG: hypothetical protein IJ600_10480 [Lachnospiraceae bacterium]|nr:hypothetical protein [Lachnospiraceae bacterium]
MKKYALPVSKYYNGEFEGLWNEMLARYAFQDNVLARTVQNYGSTVKLVCDHCGKDLLELTETDVGDFFAYLDSRVEEGSLTATTAYTYKKNLHSVGNHFERLLREKGREYRSPFHGMFHGSKAGRGKSRSSARSAKEQERCREDCVRLLSVIRKQEAEQYYFIFSMLAYFDRITPVKICEMKAEQVETGAGNARFHFILSQHAHKTQVEGRADFGAQQVSFAAVFRLPEAIEREFLDFYPAYAARMEEHLAKGRESAFYNRNYKPVNFKTLGTVFRKCNDAMGDSALQSIRDICGILYENRYCVGMTEMQGGKPI